MSFICVFLRKKKKNVDQFENKIFITTSLDPLRAYNGDDVVIQLPGELTVFKIDWLSVYDVATKTNFGSVIIPDGLNVPPSLVKVISQRSVIQTATLHRVVSVQTNFELYTTLSNKILLSYIY